MTEFTLAIIAVILIIAAIIIGLAMGVRRELNHVDDWWKPSEAGVLAKQQYDEKQADKEQKEILRKINKNTYIRKNES